MKVGYQTKKDTEFKSIEIPNEESSPILVSVSQNEKNMDNKFLIWHIEGGLGKM